MSIPLNTVFELNPGPFHCDLQVPPVRPLSPHLTSPLSTSSGTNSMSQRSHCQMTDRTSRSGRRACRATNSASTLPRTDSCLSRACVPAVGRPDQTRRPDEGRCEIIIRAPSYPLPASLRAEHRSDVYLGSRQALWAASGGWGGSRLEPHHSLDLLHLVGVDPLDRRLRSDVLCLQLGVPLGL